LDNSEGKWVNDHAKVLEGVGFIPISWLVQSQAHAGAASTIAAEKDSEGLPFCEFAFEIVSRFLIDVEHVGIPFSFVGEFLILFNNIYLYDYIVNGAAIQPPVFSKSLELSSLRLSDAPRTLRPPAPRKWFSDFGKGAPNHGVNLTMASSPLFVARYSHFTGLRLRIPR
jgi:hypothetical protein